jgi:class 3 adenylate cyclase/CHASE2 domain-containing sensor protein
LVCFTSLLVVSVSATVCLLVANAGLLRRAEMSILDLRFRQRPAVPAPSRLGTVDIDSSTIDRSGGWPLSRKLYAEMLRALRRYDVSLVSFDVLFPDPSSLVTPEHLMQRAARMASDPGQKDALRQLLDNLARTPDDEFASAIGETGFTILAQTFTRAEPALFPDTAAIAALTRSRLDQAGERRRQAIAMTAAFTIPHKPEVGRDFGLERAFAVEPPDPKLLAQAAGLGFAQAAQDPDGVMRQYPLLILYDGKLYPSIALAGICRLTDVPLRNLSVHPGKYVLIPGARWRDAAGREVTADIRIPVDRFLRMRVNWAGDYLDAFTHVPASVVLRFRAEDLMRERIRLCRDKPGELLDKGYKPAVQDVVDRGLVGEPYAQEIAMALMLAQLAETAQATADGTRADFIRAYAPDDSDADTRRMVTEAWDQVHANTRALELLKKDAGMSYAEVKRVLAVPAERDASQSNAVEFLRFIVARGKNPEEWRPLYFLPAVVVMGEGTTRTMRMSPLDLADRVLYVGLTAPGTHDYGAMPLSSVYPRVGLHVNAANTILERRFIRELPALFVFLLALACALPVACLTSRLHPALGLGLAVVLSAVYLLVGGLLFNRAGIWLPVLQPLLTVAISYTVIAVHNVLREQHERRKVHRAFSSYVAPSVVRQVLRDPAMLRLGGQRRTMTVLFSDVAGFTSISEEATPEALVSILNQYFDAVTSVIFRHEGTLDKYQGDGVMAFWNAPADQADHAFRACCAALDAVAAVRTGLFPKWKAEGTPLLATRIGLNTGPMSVGNMGSSARMSYTVIGDAVNLAARLESANKQYGTSIMISESTLQQVEGKFVVRELDLLAVKGRAKPIRVYELVARAGEPGPGTAELLAAHAGALAHYRNRRWQEAIDAFAAILARHPEDGPAKTYLSRCRTYLTSPPPQDWNGVWTMATK